ncbi:threonine/serine exporter family protein [Clostridia bacterium]|nr:threonine/serine exporter family protein [Clostridia bacterium]
MNQIMLAQLLDIGERMLISGAEVNRVEETISRMVKAYGVYRVDVFTITSSIVVTVTTELGEMLSQTRRILTYETNLDKLRKLNQLARSVVADCPASSDIAKQLHEIQETELYPSWLKLIIYGLIAGSFCIFFGGTIEDGLVAALIGIVLKLSISLLSKVERNTVMVHVLSPFLIGSLAIGLNRIGLGDQIEMILIGNIMLLIPGLSLTNSIRDIISGDTMAGILRMSEAVLVSLSIAIGFGLSTLMWGGW